VKPRLALALLVAASALTDVGAAESTQPQPVNYYAIPRIELRLRDVDQTCALVVEAPNMKAQHFKTSMPWPCSFHVDPAGKVRTKQHLKYTYLLVESSTRVSHKECETFVQAARVSGSTVQLSKHRSRLGACPPYQWETPLFTEAF
jgi:hypothetical protein